MLPGVEDGAIARSPAGAYCGLVVVMVGCRRAAEEGLPIGAVDRRCSIHRPCLGLPARRGSGVGWLRLHGVAMVSASSSKFSRRESGVRRRVSFPRWLAPDPPYIRQCLATPPAHVARSVTRPRVRRWACEFGSTAVPRNLTNEPAVGGTQGCFDCFAGSSCVCGTTMPSRADIGGCIIGWLPDGVVPVSQRREPAARCCRGATCDLDLPRR